MYGLVNRALHDLIRDLHGEARWEAVKRRAGVDVDVFLSMETYPDETTVALVVAAAGELGVAVDELLEQFGRHWISYATNHGYRDLMRARDNSVLAFIAHLDDLHSRLSLTFPELRPPAFRVEPMDARAIRLHYVSQRDGLSAFVVGLLHGLGTLFGTDLSVEHALKKSAGHSHDEFIVRLQ